MITNNILQRTFLISYSGATGSSFTMEHKGKQYLITAKHVLESDDVQNGDNIKINVFRDTKWYNLNCNVYLHYDPEIDIAVLKTEQVIFPSYPVKFALENLYLGGDLYFLGFPYGMHMEDKGIINQKFPLPFVKKGILSAMINEFSITTFFIDAHNNKGFSGGPIITVNEKGEINVVGVNVSYVKHANTLSIEESDDEGGLFEKEIEYFENSGIMKAQSIHHVIQIIEQNNL